MYKNMEEFGTSFIPMFTTSLIDLFWLISIKYYFTFKYKIILITLFYLLRDSISEIICELYKIAF